MTRPDAFCVRYLLSLCALCMLGSSAGIVIPFVIYDGPSPDQLTHCLQVGAMCGVISAFFPAAWLTYTNVDGLASKRAVASLPVSSGNNEWKLTRA